MQSINISKRAIIGVMIILIGVSYFLDALGIVDTSDIFSNYWPILLILFGIMNFLDRSSNNFFGIILILVGVFYQLQLLNILFTEIDLWELIWPVIIILAGFWLLFPKKKHTFSIDTINNAAIFSGANIVNISQTFKGGEATAVFGGLEIDLRGCDISPNEEVVIDAFAAFGGITFKIPDDWHVEMKGLPLLGGWDNKKGFPKNGVKPTKVITVKCFILCGGIDIK